MLLFVCFNRKLPEQKFVLLFAVFKGKKLKYVIPGHLRQGVH